MLWIFPLALSYFLFIVTAITFPPGSLGVRLACLASLSLIIDNTPRVVLSPTSISVTYQIVLYMAILLLVASDHLLLHKASSTHTQINQQQPFSQMSIFSRFLWSTDLILSQRGVNWSWQVPYLRQPKISRWAFLVEQSSLLLTLVALGDLSESLLRNNPVFQGTVSIRDVGFMQRVSNVLFFWWTIASSQLFNYTLSAILLVSLGIYGPYDWPSLYGHWSNARTVRIFWGQTWHQLLRRPLQEHGKFIAERIFKLSPDSRLTSYIQLYIAFFLSGFCHSVGDWAVISTRPTRSDTLVFFVLQAVIITIEDAAIFIGRLFGLLQLPSVVCYFWVISWLTWSSPIWMDGMLRAGVRFHYSDFLRAIVYSGIGLFSNQPLGASLE